jgi:hypothetical protein
MAVRAIFLTSDQRFGGEATAIVSKRAMAERCDNKTTGILHRARGRSALTKRC